MSNIWFTSDTHFHHRNIAGPKVSKWGGGYRNFEDEFEMNKHIVKMFNKYVKEEDTLYHLGDWSFGGVDKIYEFRKQLRCNNIHLLYGNHDEKIKDNKELPNCWWVTTEEQVKYTDGSYSRDIQENNLFLSDVETHRSAHAKDCFTTVGDVLEVKHGKHTFFMSHYSHRVWLGSHKGVIHLFGHSHSTLDDKPWGKSMDVGIDSAKKLLGEYRPFSIEEVINIMDKVDIKIIDSHK